MKHIMTSRYLIIIFVCMCWFFGVFFRLVGWFSFSLLIQMVDLLSDFEGELVLTSHMSQVTKSVKILQQALGGLLISPFSPLHF